MSDSDLSVFDRPIEENGVKYYVFPAGYPLFKANKNPAIRPTAFKYGIPSFFGMKNMDAAYIEAFESEYGIVFEFDTTREYKLIALDDKATQKYLYDNAPQEIQKILIENYGYVTGIRYSVGEKDKELAEYLCSVGFEGYATNIMHTDFSEFHIELLICNAKDGIRFVKRITNDRKVASILEDAKLKRHSEELKKGRKKPRYTVDDEEATASMGSPPSMLTRGNLFGTPPSTPPSMLTRGNLFNTPPSTPPSMLTRGNLFGFESPPSTPKGGKKRSKKTHKKNAKGKRKTHRQHKK